MNDHEPLPRLAVPVTDSSSGERGLFRRTDEQVKPTSENNAPSTPLSVRILYFGGLLVSCLLAGGLLFLSLFEAPAPGSDDATVLSVSSVLTLLAIGTTALCGHRMRTRDPKSWLFGTILFAMLIGTTTAVLEAVARFSLPPWPARVLHGVAPSRPTPLRDRREQEDTTSALNSWGQRDRPRELTPAADVRRIAFVGDSFLEECVGQPVSMLVEDRLDNGNEVINLGVSATGPDEYFYRVKNVALPLAAEMCVLFVYEGNDFDSPPRTLKTCLGTMAVSPRGSFFESLGLVGLNHVVMNGQRPVLEIWQRAGGLGAREEELHQAFLRASDAQAAQLLAGQVSLYPVQQEPAERTLRQPEMHAFYEMLRHPDADRFRSYFLGDAVWAAGKGRATTIDEVSTVSTEHWVRATWRVCENRHVEFLLVLVPEGFQVDPRMQEQWRPLADMKQVTRAHRAAASRLATRLREDGLHVLELADGLAGIAGTYLNLDGHWSQHGAEQVADIVADVLAKGLP